MPANLVSGEGSPPGLQTAAFLLCPYMTEGKEEGKEKGDREGEGEGEGEKVFQLSIVSSHKDILLSEHA